MPGKRMPEDTYQFSVRLPISLYEALTELAEESDRTVADQLRFILKKHLEIARK